MVAGAEEVTGSLRFKVHQSQLTDADGESKQAEASQGILDKIWPAGAQEGSAGPVVLAVVGGVEADERMC